MENRRHRLLGPRVDPARTPRHGRVVGVGKMNGRRSIFGNDSQLRTMENAGVLCRDAVVGVQVEYAAAPMRRGHAGRLVVRAAVSWRDRPAHPRGVG